MEKQVFISHSSVNFDIAKSVCDALETAGIGCWIAPRDIPYGFEWKKEIVDAIKAPAGARDVDGVKRRTRAGMGRCQSGFCGPRVLEIISRELGIDPTEVLLDKEGSYILTGKTTKGECR